VAAVDVGVGLAAAGAGAARALLAHMPRAALLLGSYGAYPGYAFTPGHLLVPSRLCAIDAAELSGKAAFPAAMAGALEPDAALANSLAAAAEQVTRGALATTLAITTDDELARELGGRSGCEGENLEALAVAHACARARVPFCALLACTNQVGSQGRSQWAQHRALAARVTSELVLRWLAQDGMDIAAR
jgi:nucleoside phosphorylase